MPQPLEEAGFNEEFAIVPDRGPEAKSEEDSENLHWMSNTARKKGALTTERRHPRGSW